MKPSPRSLAAISPKAKRQLRASGLSCCLISFGVFALSGGQSARGVSATWNGTTNATWSTTTNWSATPVPGAGNTATFNNAGNGNTSITVGTITLRTVAFDTASAAAYTLGGGTITFGNGSSTAVDIASTVTVNETINANIVLGTTAVSSNTSFINGSTSSLLTLGGNISGGTGGTATGKTLTIGGAGNTTIGGGVISNGGATLLNLVKTDAGTLTLTGANTYTGSTTVSGGVLNIRNATALGDVLGTTTVQSGAELQLQGGISVGTGELLNITGTGVSGGGVLRNISGNNTWTDTVTMANASGVVRINSDSGTLTLGGIKETGTSDKTLTFGGAGNVSVTGVIAGGSGDTALTMDGTGTLTLAGINTFSGKTLVSSGTLQLNIGTALKNSTLDTSGAGAVTLGGGVTTLNFGGLTGSGNLASVITTGYSGVTSITLTPNATLTNTYSGVIADGATGMTLTKNGTGTQILTGANSYTGKTSIPNGTLQINSIKNVNGGSSAVGAPVGTAAGTIAIGAAGTAGTLIYTGSGDTTDRVINLAGAGGAVIDQSGASGLLKFTSDLTATGAGTKTLTLTGSSSGTGEIGGKIVDNSGTNTTSLAKAGTGTWTLSGANTYTGATTVNGGKLTIGSTGTINSTSGISIGGGELNYNSSTSLSKAITFSGTGGTLSGTGTITPAVTVTSGNTYTPGAVGAVGTQTLTGGVTFNSGSIFQWDIATSAGTETGHDTVTAAVSGTGAIFNVVLGGGAYTDTFWDANRTWSDVFSTGTLASVFNSIGGTGIVWDSGTSRGNVAGQGYFTKTSSTLSWTAVPEPTSALAGLLLGAGLLRRRRSLRVS